MSSPINWYRWRRNLRRERLLKKWGKTSYFTKRAISEKLELEYYSVLPNDGQWHNVALTVESWVKKTGEPIKIANVSLYDNGMQVDKYMLLNGKKK